MTKMMVNKNGVGYFKVSKSEFSKRMGNDKFYCDECNKYVPEGEDVVVIPFLNSAYCLKCGEERAANCNIEGPEEIAYKGQKEKWFKSTFKING